MIILCDFDKTITLKDSTDEMVRLYNEEKLHDIMRRFRAKEINIKTYLSETLSLVGEITPDEFFRNMGKDLEIDPYFKEFMEKRYEFIIVSAGTEENIDAVFSKNNINIEQNKIYANTLNFSENGITVNFIYDANCGFCGVCKKKILGKYREKYNKIVYIGDGSSDICAAREADVVFARRGERLAKIFEEENRPVIIYDSFKDVIEGLELIA